MFAGIVEATGRVVGVGTVPRRDASGASAFRLDVEAAGVFDGLQPGASVAINGACLTLVEKRGAVGTFDVVSETWRNTSLRTLHANHIVNIERSLRVGDRIDGHFVQGHVDGVGRVERVEREGGEWKLWVTVGADLMPYIHRKGSIALDGTSLTVVDVEGSSFSVVLIPTTLQRTVLAQRRAGDPINVETDILARIVLSQLAAAGLVTQSPPQSGSGITMEGLREGGYV